MEESTTEFNAAAFEASLTSIDVSKLRGTDLYNFLQDTLDYINDLAKKIQNLEESHEEANEILEKLNELRKIFLQISIPPIEENDVINLYNRVHFVMKYYIGHAFYLKIIHDMSYFNKSSNRQYRINFNISYNSLLTYLQSEILEKLFNVPLEEDEKKIIQFNSYYMICDMILNLNSIKRMKNLKLNNSDIAKLFSNFVHLTNIALDNTVAKCTIEKLLPRFFEVVTDKVWNENIKSYKEETLRNLKEIREEWLKKEREKNPFHEDLEDLDELARKIEGDTKHHQNGLGKNKKLQFKDMKSEGRKSRKSKKKTRAQKRNNFQNTQQIQTNDRTDRFLADLSKSIRQLKEEDRNKHSQTCNSQETPENSEYRTIGSDKPSTDSDEPSLQSFTNK